MPQRTQTTLLPFFCLYGGKWRCAPRYPAPTHKIIVEPFAGAAGYSVRYPHLDVVLIEKDDKIASLWAYLIGSSSKEIADLPLFPVGGHIDDLHICEEAKTLIGFWLNKGCSRPMKSESAWMRAGKHKTSFWGERIRHRISKQVSFIKHWKIFAGDYSTAPDIEASWFIDPPYQEAGRLYKHSSKDINYESLADWCKTRRGQVMVCENDGAKWLPFSPYITIKSTEGKYGKSQSKESIWQNS